jgi:hypothetical protein
MTIRGLLPLMSMTLVLGCEPTDKPDPPSTPAGKAAEKAKDTPKPVASKKKALNQAGTVSLETFEDGRRRVLVEAAVCLREGPLELLMCRRGTKEHEAILHSPAFAHEIHAALLAAGGKPGNPAKYSNEKPFFTPASGTTIKVTLEYEKKAGENATIDAKEWVRNANTHKALDKDWVFAGSRFFQDPDDPKTPPYYLANNGDVICVSNFVDAMLDLPINSPKENNELAFEAWTERIPAINAKVTVILEPVVEKKDKEKK